MVSLRALNYRCFSPSGNLEDASPLRFRELDDVLKETLSHDPIALWDVYGIAADVEVIAKFCHHRFDTKFLNFSPSRRLPVFAALQRGAEPLFEYYTSR